MRLPRLSEVRELFRTEPAPHKRHIEAVYGGQRGKSGPRHFGSHGPETLAAGPLVRSRARHAYANNGYICNAVDAIIAEAVGAGIEANSAHPDKDIAALIDRTETEIGPIGIFCSNAGSAADRFGGQNVRT